MGRYRKIDSRVWNDEKFNSLSDRGKLVFFMLLTHPGMTSLGAMRATLGGFAEELGWSPEGFREAFQEAFSKGMVEHDQRACLVALPNFLRYNPPENPNVVKAWVGALDLLPECGLKTRVVARARAFAEGLSEAFAKALPEPFVKGMAIPEPEPEQIENPPSPPSGLQGAPQPLVPVVAEAKPKRKRRTQQEILAPFPEGVRDVVNTLGAEWHRQDPDGRPIDVRPEDFGEAVSRILAAQTDLTPEVLIEAGRAYLGSPRRSYKAPQWFFGVGKPDDPAQWVGYVRGVLTRQQREAQQRALPLAAGE